jgi:glucose 1-dehydrogenase
MTNFKQLNGKVAIVTGGGQGIGKAISLSLAEAGARLVIAFKSSDAGANEVVEQAKRFDAAAVSVRADMENSEDLEKLVEAAMDAFGTIDILVNNAGIAIYCPFLEMPAEIWNRVIHTNLTAAFELSQRVARIMVRRGTKGSIVNISSVGGFFAQKGLSHYNASKGGLNLLTKAMALELGPHGIRVNAIAPGAIEVERNRASLVEGAYPQEWKRIIPLGRWGQPEEIAKIVLFLSGDESGFITGHILCADGGQSAQVPQPGYDFEKWETQ